MFRSVLHTHRGNARFFMIANVDCLSDDDGPSAQHAAPAASPGSRSSAASASQGALVERSQASRSTSALRLVSFGPLKKQLHQIVLTKCKCSALSKTKPSCFRRFQGEHTFTKLLQLRKDLASMEKQDQDRRVV